jgi:hypothetical protein
MLQALTADNGAASAFLFRTAANLKVPVADLLHQPWRRANREALRIDG